jgi:Ca2+-binding RTX toxin-like protein
MATFTAGPGGVDMSAFDAAGLANGEAISATTSKVVVTYAPSVQDEFYGAFTLDSSGQPVSGTLTGVHELHGGQLAFQIDGLSLDWANTLAAIGQADAATTLSALLGGADTLIGSAQNDVLMAFGGQDQVMAGAGNDTIDGGAGNDTIDGGAGTDVALYAGNSSDFTISYLPNGYWSVADNRAGSPSGTDQLIRVEIVRFTDRDVTIGVDLSASIEAMFQQVLRTGGSTPTGLATATAVAVRVAAGASDAAVAPDIVKAAGATSSVATLAYEFFTGKAPSAAGMDYLVSPTGPNPNNLNSAYYQSFSLENRYINFAVNLGKLGDGKAAFTAAYGGLSLFDATRQAYTTIFGAVPSDAKIHALLDPTAVLGGQTLTRADYFAYYGQDGANGVGTKAAMVGWLLSEAVKADLGTYALSNDAFLADVGLHNAAFGVDLIGVYARPEYVYHPT